jgi:hypothetical protein
MNRHKKESERKPRGFLVLGRLWSSSGDCNHRGYDDDEDDDPDSDVGQCG